MMQPDSELKRRVKQLLVDNLLLPVPLDQIGDDQPLFGPGGLGLDSVDALQLVVALEKEHGLKLATPEAARPVLHSVNALATALAEHGAAATPPVRPQSSTTR